MQTSTKLFFLHDISGCSFGKWAFLDGFTYCNFTNFRCVKNFGTERSPSVWFRLNIGVRGCCCDHSMHFSRLGVFLISVKPLTTENTKNKTTQKICKVTVTHSPLCKELIKTKNFGRTIKGTLCQSCDPQSSFVTQGAEAVIRQNQVMMSFYPTPPMADHHGHPLPRSNTVTTPPTRR